MDIIDTYRNDMRALSLTDNTQFDLVLIINEFESGDFQIKTSYCNQNFEGEGEDCFTAFQCLRDLLIKHDIGLQCYGSMINVYPSPMMRAGGMKAYVLEMGKPATIDKTVNFMETIEIGQFATSEEQSMFYENWLSSLK